MQRVPWSGIFAVGVVGAFLVGHDLGTARTPAAGPIPSTPREHAMAPADRAVVVSGGASAEVIRQIVREELAARAEVAPLPAAPLPQREEGQEAVQRAHAILDAALARGRWIETDRQDMRRQLSLVTTEQTKEILGQIIPALNSGRLRSEVLGPPI